MATSLALTQTFVGTGRSPVFAGRLEDISLPSLLLILEAERKTGILLLIGQAGKSALFLQDGRVVRAHRSSRKEASHAAAVYSLLTWTSGNFDFQPYQGVVADEIGCSTSRLIMEGARRLRVGEDPIPARRAPGSRVGTRIRRRRTTRVSPGQHRGPSGLRDAVVYCFLAGFVVLMLLAMLDTRPRMPTPSANGGTDSKVAGHP